MRFILAMAVVAGALSAPLAWADAPAGAGKVFSGPEGEQVALVPLTSNEGRNVLVYIQGTGGVFDGKVLLHEVVERQDRVDYQTRYRGETFITLTLQAGQATQRRRQLHVPGRQIDVPLTYDDARTRALKVQEVYALHQKQQADGTLARLMAFDREARMAAQEQALAKAVASLNTECGTSVKAAVVWDTIFQVPLPPGGLTGSHFLEPRFATSSAPTEFRGVDMRLYSEVVLDLEKQSCELRCGAQPHALKLLELTEAKKLLEGAKYVPNPRRFVPHALLRDTRGTYYFVERGFHALEEKHFRIHIGPKGSLKQQEMKDVVSDSEGQIFSTRSGDLRLVVDRAQPSMWIEKERRVELRVIPVSENLPLIYNELGVYAGVRLGTPCDECARVR